MGTEIRRVLRLAKMLDLPHSVIAKTYCVQGDMRNTVLQRKPLRIPFRLFRCTNHGFRNTAKSRRNTRGPKAQTQFSVPLSGAGSTGHWNHISA
jgi:hypothetical protein